MKSTIAIFACAAALTVVASARANAADGIQIVETVTTGTTPPRKVQVQIDHTHMRTELVGPTGARQVVIFDGPNQVLYLIDMDRKTYTEMTRADVERLASQAQGARAAVEAQMANLPPAQRAQMEAMMKGRGMGMTPPTKPEYRRNGTDKVGRWTCDKYDGYQDGEKTSEVCTVPPGALGLGAGDLDITRQMAEFYARLLPQASNQISSIGKLEDQGFSGFPVKSVSKVAGGDVTMEVSEAGRTAIPASAFALPPGFTKQTMPMMGGPGRGR